VKDFYEEINRSLTPIEQGRYSQHSLDWCADRIDWCWKWRKITYEQMVELANRVSSCYDAEIAAMKVAIYRK
jgi:hypothetical protein